MQKQFENLLKHHCIALTGGIATGKSTIADLLRQKGYVVIDADQCARKAVAAGTQTLKDIVARFGERALLDSQTLNRDFLRNLISHDSLAKRDLEAIMHPAIQKEFAMDIQKAGLFEHPKLFFYEATLIHELGRGSEFLATWCSICSEETQIERLLQRSQGKISQAEAINLIKIQMPLKEKAKQSTVTIDTGNTIQSVEKQLDALLPSLAE